MIKNKNYKYLLRLYTKVDDYLANVEYDEDDLTDIVVSFCIVVEKIFKIKLYKKNPLLVFDSSKMKEDDALITIIRKKEINIETIKIRAVISRYKLMFKRGFSEEEMQALLDIYEARNHLVHGYKSDEYLLLDKENIVKKMGTIWEEISKQSIILFGKNVIKANKPRNKYTDEELEMVLREEVKKKISRKEKFNITKSLSYDVVESLGWNVSAGEFSLGQNMCPRCGARGFSTDGSEGDLYSMSSLVKLKSDLYKCKKCNLELTQKEYEIAKEIKPRGLLNPDIDG